MGPIDRSNFSETLLAWYAKHRRELPWRDHPEPYAIWVSEIMLQQTRVDTVLPYFERWMKRYPTIRHLAKADQMEVLNLWEGLGYYSRARNLHKAAQKIVEEFNGNLPADVKLLKKLPGIGPYTAGAIASLAFGQDEPVVDGNVRRVLSRVFNVEVPVDKPEGSEMIWELAADHLPSGKARDYNQALMELGALVCLPRNPTCDDCPVQAVCEAYRLGIQAELPVLKPRMKTPHITVTAAIIRQKGLVMITQRPQEGLLGGMWEFPGGKLEEGEDLSSCLEREICEELGVRISVGQAFGVYRHAYTHFKVTLHAFECALDPAGQEMQQNGVAAIRWIAPKDLKDYPMGKIDRQIASRIYKELLERGRDG